MQKDDEKPVVKGDDPSWSLNIANIYDYDVFYLDPPHFQFTAQVEYRRGDNLARWVWFLAGGEQTKAIPAGKAGDTGTIDFPLTFATDTTASVQAEVKDAAMAGSLVFGATPRSAVTFVGPGMGFAGAAVKGGPDEWKSEVAATSRVAATGGAVPAGLYRGKFRQFDKLFRASARIHIQGEPLAGPQPKKGVPCPPCRPLKLEYDLPADVSWHKIGNKYQPFWSFCTVGPLAASPGFRTVMRVVLLNSDCKVEQITTNPF